ncbi:hypothetical protein [Actinomadura sp. CNU-125]|uniref:hypothetical protein n=1 Tax=Actinomadura sp. CNU-125 TaxID=1904961 RepID=UPI00117770A8|nr:hypothetical protein [Actinomadura sp. CNU-125]
MVAAEALARNVDSPALRELAGCSALDDARDIRALHLDAMAELGLSMPEADRVLWEKARQWARRMVDETVRPHEGALRIDRYSVVLESPNGLAEFTYLLDLWGEYPALRKELEISMVEEARRLLRLSDNAA